MFLKHKYLQIILLTTILFYVTSCSRLPKNPDSQNKTILIIKDDLFNSSAQSVEYKFKFNLESESGSIDEFWLTPSGNIRIIKSLDVGSYSIKSYESVPVNRSNQGTRKHNMSGSFQLEYGKITILDKKISYKQEAWRNGGWQAKWRIESLSYSEKQKIISELRKDENFNKWSMYKYEPTISNENNDTSNTSSCFVENNTWYRLTNRYIGTSKALDTYSDTHGLHMSSTINNYSGQYWNFTPLGDGYYRLSNKYIGTSKALDTYANTHGLHMSDATKNYSGQYWKLTQIE